MSNYTEPKCFKNYSDAPTNNGWYDTDWPPPYSHREIRDEREDDEEDIPLEEEFENNTED